MELVEDVGLGVVQPPTAALNQVSDLLFEVRDVTADDVELHAIDPNR